MRNTADEIVWNVETAPAERVVQNSVPLQTKRRWSSLDLARGIAITLMILSHCVKGLMYHSRIPDWGLIPIHLLTKFSSSLFILVFGLSLSLYFLPLIGSEKWPGKRTWMLKRGIELMVWYKILTIVQMFQFYPKSMIVDTLLFKRMPDFVEILSFYSIALLWIPFVLPIWSKSHWFIKVLWPTVMIALGQYLHHHFDFWGYETLKALIAEEKGFYTFGQLQRGGLVFIGLLMGDVFKHLKASKQSLKSFAMGCMGIGLLGLGTFYALNSTDFTESLIAIAKNVGKHPFALNFFLFSVGGAMAILGLSLLSNRSVHILLAPLIYLGKNSMNAFILHIIIIFYFYRYAFALHHNVTYLQSLGLTAGCLVATIILLYIWNTTKAVFS
jgi:fucose 4-O-acetylase-like acetyltransferase